MFWSKKFNKKSINKTNQLSFYQQVIKDYHYSSKEYITSLNGKIMEHLNFENELLLIMSSIDGYIIPVIDIDKGDLTIIRKILGDYKYSRLGIIESNPKRYWIFDSEKSRNEYSFDSMTEFPMADLNYYLISSKIKKLLIRGDFKKNVFPIKPKIIQHSPFLRTFRLMTEIVKHFDCNYDLLIRKWERMSKKNIIEEFKILNFNEPKKEIKIEKIRDENEIILL